MNESSSSPVTEKIQQEIKKIPPTTDRNLLAAVSYVWILSIVLLIVKKDPFVHFHAKQALVLFLLSLLGFIPVVGWLIAFAAFIGMVIGFIHAWQGQEYQLPYVYGWSQRIHF